MGGGGKAGDVGQSVGPQAEVRNLLQLVLKRALIATDIEYESYPVEGGEHQASIKIVNFDGGALFYGNPQKTESDAQDDAAKLAIEELKGSLSGASVGGVPDGVGSDKRKADQTSDSDQPAKDYNKKKG